MEKKKPTLTLQAKAWYLSLLLLGIVLFLAGTVISIAGEEIQAAPYYGIAGALGLYVYGRVFNRISVFSLIVVIYAFALLSS